MKKDKTWERDIQHVNNMSVETYAKKLEISERSAVVLLTWIHLPLQNALNKLKE